MSNCKSGYGEHDFCVFNTRTNKLYCCNCGKEKGSEWDKEFEDILTTTLIQVKVGTYKEVIFSDKLFNLLNTYICYPNRDGKVKIKCKDGCIQIERIK